MKVKLDDFEIKTEIPIIPSTLPVFETQESSFESRKPVIEQIGKEMRLGRLRFVEVQDSVHMLSEEGEIQYYRPSGAIWAQNLLIEKKFENEKREWKIEKSLNDLGDEELILQKDIEKKMIDRSKELFTKLGFLDMHSFFADVSLEQITNLNEKGEIINQFVGEAVVRFLYKLENILVDGGGAKTYAFFSPYNGEVILHGVFHSWRGIMNSRQIDLSPIEDAIKKGISRDSEIKLYLKKKYKVILRDIQLVYYALPPFKHQKFLFPALRVYGSVTKYDKEKKQSGFEFARYYHVVDPDVYMKSELYSHYLVSRI